VISRQIQKFSPRFARSKIHFFSALRAKLKKKLKEKNRNREKKTEKKKNKKTENKSFSALRVN